MAELPESLDGPSRRTVEAFMNCYLEQDAESVKDLLAEDATFQGAFSGGVLHGRHVIASHFRQSFRGIFTRGIVRFHEVIAEDRQVFLRWELAPPVEGAQQAVQAHTTLELDQDGLILRIKALWDPKPLLGWEDQGK